MTLNIVAISGKICSGKTTLAKNIIAKEPYYVRVPLAQPLKEDIAALPGVNKDLQYIQDNKDLFRPILQYYGTDIARKIQGEGYWVQRFAEYVKSKGYGFVIVDDVRYPNEVDGLAAIADRFMSVRLLVDTEIQMNRYEMQYGESLSPMKMLHLSETSLDDYIGFDQLLNGNIQPEVLAVLTLDAMKRRYMTETLDSMASKLVGYTEN